MTGARKLAYDKILAVVRSGRVLEVGAGDAPLPALLAAQGCEVVAVDVDIARLRHAHAGSEAYEIEQWDVSGSRPLGRGAFDAVVSVYCLQHLLEAEAHAWARLRDLVNSNGRLIVVGRYRAKQGRELDRGDPLNGYNVEGLRALGISTGWNLACYNLFRYDAERYETSDHEHATAFFAEFLVW